MRIGNFKYLPYVLTKSNWLLVIVGFVGGGLLGFIFWKYLYPAIDKDTLIESIAPFTIAAVTVAMIFGSLILYIAQTLIKKPSLTPVTHAMCLIIFSIILSIVTIWHPPLYCWAISFFLVGTGIAFYEIAHLTTYESLRATILERVTLRSRKSKEFFIFEVSPISEKVFQNNIVVYKGDTIYANCDSIEAGRILARKIIECGNYGIYITVDRFFSMIEGEYDTFSGKLYCIDCGTHSYGYHEFKNAEKHSNSYTINPPTIKILHNTLRHIRRRTVSQIKCGKDWTQLCRADKATVDVELASKEAMNERQENVKIIYDSVSSLSAIFGWEHLLHFFIHDTNVDKTIGRNTLLINQKDQLDKAAGARLESICQVSLDVKQEDSCIRFVVNKARGEKKSSNFLIPF